MIALAGEVEVLRRVDPSAAGWRYLHFLLARVVGQAEGKAEGLELALVPLEGEAVVETPSAIYTLGRASVFRGPPHVLYLPRIRPSGYAL